MVGRVLGRLMKHEVLDLGQFGALPKGGVAAPLRIMAEIIVTPVEHLAGTSLPNREHRPPAGCRQRIRGLPGLRPPRPPKCNKRSPGKHTNRRYQHELCLRDG